MKRIPSLDGLRAVSISFVIASHLLLTAHTRDGLSSRWAKWIDGGNGVFIFFVISGYLITKLLMREFDRKQDISLRRFYFRRFFRIVPPLYLYILFVVVSVPLSGIHTDTRSVLTAMTFTRNLDLHARGFEFEHFWSLCIEEQFYLLWPVCLLLALRRKGRTGAIRVTILLILLAPAYRLATFPLIHNQPLRHYVDGLLPGYMDSLMFGCWAALAEGRRTFERLYAGVARFVWFLPIWFLGISQWLFVRFGNEYRLSIGQTFNGLAIVVMLLWVVRNSDSFAGKILNWPPIVHYGVISYSVYIWQTYFLHVGNDTRFGRIPVNLLCIFICAEFSWQTVERLSRWVRDRLETTLDRSWWNRLGSGAPAEKPASEHVA